MLRRYRLDDVEPGGRGLVSDVAWQGADILRGYLVPIADLRDAPSKAGDADRVLEALRREGQVRPVLLANNGVDVVSRQHLLDAARTLGWTHIAARPKVAEELGADTDQMTLLDVLARDAKTEEEADAMVSTLARKTTWEEADDDEIQSINEASAKPDHEWVGLPEYVPADDSYKVVVSCETEDDRDALFDVLGIKTIHKGTRGTLSVWWPDRARKDLASLRFIAEGEKP